MRLIDADAVSKDLIIVSTRSLYIKDGYNHVHQSAIMKALNFINDAPTIDAVPRSEFEQLIRERDAAVADLKRYAPCPTCKTVDIEHCINCVFCNTNGKTGCKNKWEWRGVQDEQTD